MPSFRERLLQEQLQAQASQAQLPASGQFGVMDLLRTLGSGAETVGNNTIGSAATRMIGDNLEPGNLGNNLMKLANFGVDSLAANMNSTYEADQMAAHQLQREQAMNQRNKAYITEALGQQANNPQGIDIASYDPLTQELLAEDGITQGSGYLKHRDKRQFAGELMAAPAAITRTAGGAILRDLQGNTSGSTGFTNVQRDPRTNKFIGLNRESGRMEYIPTQVNQIAGTEHFQYGADAIQAEGSLKREFNQMNKNFKMTERAWARVSNALDTGLGDIAMIFNIMKVFEPNNQVTEGEAANIQNSSGIPSMLVNLYNQALHGRKLGPKARQDILNQAKVYYESAYKENKGLRSDYVANAMQYGLNPRNVVGSNTKFHGGNSPQLSGTESQAPTEANTPKIGDTRVVNGKTQVWGKL